MGGRLKIKSKFLGNLQGNFQKNIPGYVNIIKVLKNCISPPENIEGIQKRW